MPNFTNLTVEQMRKASKADIIAAVGKYLDALDKKQVIELLMDVTEFADTPVITTGEHGILTREQTVRDAEGEVIREEEYNAQLV